MNPNIYLKLRDFLLDHDVRLFPHTSVSEIRNNGVVIIDGKELLFLRADTVVLAVGADPDNKLAEEIRNMVPKLYRIGDCVEVRTILDATNEGAEVGREI
jgi:NADH dehydrogenase FAD-containing subunit